MKFWSLHATELLEQLILIHTYSTQGVIVTKLNRLTHKIAIKLHLVVDSCTNCSYRSRRPARKLLDTPSCDYERQNAHNITRDSNHCRKVVSRTCMKFWLF